MNETMGGARLNAPVPPAELTERERFIWQLGFNMGCEMTRLGERGKRRRHRHKWVAVCPDVGGPFMSCECGDVRDMVDSDSVA